MYKNGLAFNKPESFIANDDEYITRYIKIPLDGKIVDFAREYCRIGASSPWPRQYEGFELAAMRSRARKKDDATLEYAMDQMGYEHV